MNKLAYIATLLYLPLTLGYALFCPENPSIIWNKYFFALDKLFIVALLVTLHHKEILRGRQWVYRAGLGLIILFLLYILLDWREVYNYNATVVTGYCLLGILFYTVVLIRYRYDHTDQR